MKTVLYRAMQIRFNPVPQISAAQTPRPAAEAKTLGIVQSSPSARDTEKRKLADALEALTKIAASRTDQASSQKAEAREKVRRLKDRLTALRAMFASDPKGMARAIAQIANELSAAVKQYAAAGGASADFASVPAPQDAGDAFPPSGEPESGVSAAEQSALTGSLEQRPEVSISGQSDAKTDASGKQGGAEVDPYRKQIEQQRTELAQSNKQNDMDFRDDVRNIARQLKALLEAMKDKGQAKNEDAEAAAKDIYAAENTLNSTPPDSSVSVTPGTTLSLSA